MKKSSGPLVFRPALMVAGEKIVGTLDKVEKEQLLKMIAEDISNMTTLLSFDRIFNILMKTNIYCVTYRKTFSAAEGCSIGNNIFIHKNVITYLNNNYDFRRTSTYSTILHECIHRIQNSFSLNVRDNFLGIVEGVTESEVEKYYDIKLGHEVDKLRFNFSITPYSVPVAFVRQLERIYGNEVIQKIAYNNDRSIVAYLKRDYGNEVTNELLKVLSASAKYGNYDKIEKKLFDLQYILMIGFFEKKLRNVKSKKDAEKLLSDYKNYMSELIQFPNMEIYEKNYNDILNYLNNRYKDLDIEKNKYEDPKLYPLSTLETRLFTIEDSEMSDICFGLIDENDINKTMDNCNNYDPSNYKRYRLIKDNDIFEIIIKPDNTGLFSCLYGDINKRANRNMSYIYYDEKKCKFVSFDSSVEFDPSTGILKFERIPQGLDNNTICLKQEEFNLSQEDVFEKMYFDYNIDLYQENTDNLKL